MWKHWKCTLFCQPDHYTEIKTESHQIVNSLKDVIITAECSIKLWLHRFLLFILCEASLWLTAASSSPHLILNQLCWLVLTLYFSYFTGSCRSRSPGETERETQSNEEKWKERFSNSESQRGGSENVCVCTCVKLCVEKRRASGCEWSDNSAVHVGGDRWDERNEESRKLYV